MNRVGKKVDTFQMHLAGEIANGVYRSGEKLPSERELGERYQVSRTTIRQALVTLEDAQLIFRRPPVGTFVAEGALARIPKWSKRTALLKVAFIMPSGQVDNPLMLSIFDAVRRYVGDSVEISVVFCDLLAHAFCEEGSLEGERPDIAVVFGSYSDSQLELLSRHVEVVVLLNRCHDDYSYLSADNFSGGRIMAEYAWKTGHRHWGIIGPLGTGDECDFARRLAGIRAFAQEKHVAWSNYSLSLEETMNLTPSCFFALDELFQRDPQISVILCLYDRAALSVVEALRKRDLGVPEDISVIGFDDQRYVQFVRPPLTTVKYPADALGARLARFIEEVAAGQNEGRIHEDILPLLVERKTVKTVNR